MPETDKRVDTYIGKAEPFARPILTHLRKLIHEACPAVTETLKWGMPSFEYKGLLAGMAAFKNHIAFGYWKTSLMADPYKVFADDNAGMGSLGKIKSLADLPEDHIILEYTREAMKLNEQGIKAPQRSGKPAVVPETPDYFLKALKRNQRAFEVFEAFSPSHKKEYIEWITEAKTEVTRERRIAQAIEWMSEGKPRNWKYMRK